VRSTTNLALLLSLQLFGCAAPPTAGVLTDAVGKVVTKTTFTKGGGVNYRDLDYVLGPGGRALLTELWQPTTHFRYTIELESGRLISVESLNDASIGECVWARLPREASHLAAFSLGQAEVRGGASCTETFKING
jgi:hypothetical protein